MTTIQRPMGPATVASTASPRRRPLVTLLGPAFVAAVAYVDPGNVATNLRAGAQYGYLLVWVLVLATVTAGLVQFLSAKLGVVTGSSMSELLRSRIRTRSGRLGYWLQAETVVMATDLAEVIGGAVAMNLLFGVPLLLGGVLTGCVSLLLLSIQNRRGQRQFERVVTGLLLVIAVGFVAGMFFAPPSPGGVAGGLVPRFAGSESVVLAAAMFGATVMPHVVYLHSALSRDRFGHVPRAAVPRLIAATRLDVTAAMLLAGGVNIAMLLVAASALRSQTTVTIEEAHAAVNSSLGPVIATLFAVGLLVSGLASTSVGCHAGSEVMGGLLGRTVPLVIRRTVTLVPALLVLAAGAEPTGVLVISQVVLSLGLPFVLIPLVWLTSDPAIMGNQANTLVTTVLAWTVAGAIIALNLVLVAGFLGLGPA